MDSKEKYNHIVFLETIKTGRMPKRSGLGTRLLLLGGYTGPVNCTIKKNSNKRYNFAARKGLTNRLCFYRNWFGTYQNKDLFCSDEMKTIYQKYLGDHHIEFVNGYAFVYYSPDVIINWGQLDEDLKIKYPNKHKVDKRGFVYYKY